MARDFAPIDGNDSTEWLSDDVAAANAYPISMGCWFNVDNITDQHTLMFLGDKDVGNKFMRLDADGNGSDRVRILDFATEIGFVDSTTVFSADTWHHALGVFTSNSSRTVYLDGGSSATETTAVTDATADFDRTSIGLSRDSTPLVPCNGSIAECGIWTAALTAADALMLAAGYSPLFVKPQNLASYDPLIRGITDRMGKISLTASGTTVIQHPRIIYPTTRTIHVPAVVGRTTRNTDPQPLGIGAGMSRWMPD